MKITKINEIKQASEGNFIKLVIGLSNYGITHFITNAKTARSTYFDVAGNSISDADIFDFTIGTVNVEQFVNSLKEHQCGEIDFSTWLAKTTESGVASWEVIFSDKTCTYFDCDKNVVHTEYIPM